MRFLFGHVGASLAAAFVAALWVVFGAGDQTIARSFGVPDLLGTYSPTLAIATRQALAFHAGASQPLAALIDLAVAVPLFMILNLGGLLLFTLIDGVWKGEPEWDKIKPVWGAFIFSTLAIVVVLGSRRYGLPPFGQLRVQFLGIVAASAVAGLLTGMRGSIPDPVGRDY